MNINVTLSHCRQMPVFVFGANPNLGQCGVWCGRALNNSFMSGYFTDQVFHTNQTNLLDRVKGAKRTILARKIYKEHQIDYKLAKAP